MHRTHPHTEPYLKMVRTPFPAAAATTRCPFTLVAMALQLSASAPMRDQWAPLFTLRQIPYMVHAFPRRSRPAPGQEGVTA